jgi:hypothetical protein
MLQVSQIHGLTKIFMALVQSGFRKDQMVLEADRWSAESDVRLLLPQTSQCS